MINLGIEPSTLQEIKSQEKEISWKLSLYISSPPSRPGSQVCIAQVSSEFSSNNRKHSTLCGTCPPTGEGIFDYETLFFNGIQHSNDYKLQYTIATMATIIRTIRNIQSVISVSQTISPIAPIIIAVIAIAANNFARSITLYRLRNKFVN